MKRSTYPTNNRRRASVAACALSLTLTCIPFVSTPNAARAQEIDGAAPILRSPHAIPGRYIVVFKDVAGKRASEDVTADMAANYGATPEFVYSTALQGFSAAMSEDQAVAMSRDPRVAYIEEDGVVSLDPTEAETSSDGDLGVSADAVQPNATFGLDRIDQRRLPLNGTYAFDLTGAGVSVFVLDTGIRPTHTEFEGRASILRDFIDDDGNTATDANNDDGDPSRSDGFDCNGHGTNVAGIVAGRTFGVAKQARIFALRVLDCTGSGSNAGIAAALDFVTALHPRPAVINMSLGGPPSITLDAAVRRAIEAGVTVVVAAGNDGVDASNLSPARVGEAITVGATDDQDNRALFNITHPGSNIGPVVDLFAPGKGIASAGSSSDTALSTFSGTSQASPHVAGAAALHLQVRPGDTPAQVRDALVAASTSNLIVDAGAGSPNRLLCTRFALRPAAPRLLSATANLTSVRLTWQDRLDNEAGFRVFRLQGTSRVLVATVGPNQTVATITGLVPFTRQTFTVRAFNLAGESIDSNRKTVTTGL